MPLLSLIRSFFSPGPEYIGCRWRHFNDFIYVYRR